LEINYGENVELCMKGYPFSYRKRHNSYRTYNFRIKVGNMQIIYLNLHLSILCINSYLHTGVVWPLWFYRW